MDSFLQCVGCKKKYKLNEIRYRCDCGEILEVKRADFDKLKNLDRKTFDKRLSSREFPFQSGVWRFKELVLPVNKEYIVSKPEGNTNLYTFKDATFKGYERIVNFVELAGLYLKHEGENPTGSFKDRGMTVGITQAKVLGVKAVACASTGNTSSSLASYAATAGLKCFVFLPKGKIAAGKLAQSLAYGAINIQIDGDFDSAMKMVTEICSEYGIYLLNSINPFRIEGQKTIIFETLQQLNWEMPDWVVLPGGNLGNTSAIGKGLFELKELGIINKLPRIAVIQAEGANPFYLSYKNGFKKRIAVKAETIASAIRIGRPVSFVKAKKVIEEINGIVEQVSDREILDAKEIVDASGIGCELASAATIAGVKKLVNQGIIKKQAVIVGILTGHILKDPDTSMDMYEKNIVRSDTAKIHKVIRRLLRDCQML